MKMSSLTQPRCGGRPQVFGTAQMLTEGRWRPPRLAAAQRQDPSSPGHAVRVDLAPAVHPLHRVIIARAVVPDEASGGRLGIGNAILSALEVGYKAMAVFEAPVKDDDEDDVDDHPRGGPA